MRTPKGMEDGAQKSKLRPWALPETLTSSLESRCSLRALVLDQELYWPGWVVGLLLCFSENGPIIQFKMKAQTPDFNVSPGSRVQEHLISATLTPCFRMGLGRSCPDSFLHANFTSISGCSCKHADLSSILPNSASTLKRYAPSP